MRLTDREQEVAKLLFEDYTRPTIARRIGCSRETVRAHIDRIYEKLAVQSRVQFVLRLVRAHLLLQKQK
jgi:LuxR family transcriptional regulator of spore coat protein